LSCEFNIACINRCTEAEGPGKRLAIWFQGCDKHCEGCCNPELLAIRPAHIISIDALLRVISEAKEEFGIEGVTYLGGEPTLQQGLPELSAKIKGVGLGVILFTGNTVEELDDKIRSSVDMIIDGRFEDGKVDSERNLIGSTNQRIVHMTGRYRSHEDWFYTLRPKLMEINISDRLFITGDYLN